MPKNWNEEWDMENAEVLAIQASYEKMRNCDHEWSPIGEESRDLFSEDAEECHKCGGVQIKVSDEAFTRLTEVLEESRVSAEED